ncbi:hypothetical protein M8C21_027037 [Ambrosia artemisiifolia]|uniref:Uncharacterized protein n=1 Tax=Ambrosia artemisiifolia TaxID=4212 RepID=A0AAD5D8K4_AMBAR|nr:hypothetical protein M8C21_027037 [Ambrosia artemisiifolia]
MAMLAHCWFIIEYSLIPDGFRKWFFLSFYVNPFFLFFCQIFLWIKTLQRWIFLIIFLLNRHIFTRVLGVLTRFLIIPLLSSKFSDSITEPEDDEDMWYEVNDSFINFHDMDSKILFLRYERSLESPKVTVYDVYFELVDQETVSICSSSGLGDEIMNFSGASSPVSSYSFSNHKDVDVISSTRSSTCTLLEDDMETANNIGVNDGTEYELTDFQTPLLVVKPDHEEENDSFYNLYTERMKWFDLLNQERTCGLNEFLTQKQYMGDEKRIVKSMESDFEMVYVAQSCLSWEALYYEYRKLESIIAASCADTTCTSPSYGALCSSTLVNKFQRFQILLERFMEDERSEKGKRYWNFIQKRSSINSLLQVPHISGISCLTKNVDVYKEGMNKGLTIRAADLLKKIEKCMKTFKSFIELDEKKPWWRAPSRLSWNRSPLEDPRDLNLLHNVTRTLRQKELWMKDLYGKQRCWLRKKVKIMAEVEKKEMMFAMIELKLVSRVLMMSVISTSQLQWCQQKLDSIEISHGRITRSSCTGSMLFPPA